MKLWSLPVSPDDKNLFQCHVTKTAQHYAIIGGSILVLGPLLYSGIYNVAFRRRVPFCDFLSSVCPHTDPCVVHHVHDDACSSTSPSSTPTSSRPRTSEGTAAAVSASAVETVSQSSPVLASVLRKLGEAAERMQYAPTSTFARYVARTATATFVRSSCVVLAKSFAIDLISHAATLALCALLDRATAGESAESEGPAWLRALRSVLGAGLFCVFTQDAGPVTESVSYRHRTWYEFFCMATSLGHLVDFYVPCVHWAHVGVRCFLAPGWTAVYRTWRGGNRYPVPAEQFLSRLTPYGYAVLHLFAQLQQELIPRLVRWGLWRLRADEQPSSASRSSAAEADEKEAALVEAVNLDLHLTMGDLCSVYVVAAVAPAVADKLVFLQGSVPSKWRERIWTAPGPSFFLLGAVSWVPLCYAARGVIPLLTGGK